MSAVERSAAAAEELTVQVEHGYARNLVRDVNHAPIIPVDRHGVVEIAPFREIGPAAVEDLDAIVLAVGDQVAVVGMNPDGVGVVDRGTGSAAAQVPFSPPSAAEAMNDRIAVAVGNVDVAIGGDLGACRMIEGSLKLRVVALSRANCRALVCRRSVT